MKPKYNIDDNTITIDKEEYDRLVDADSFLACLENYGVDSWEGYDEAINSHLNIRNFVKENNND